MPGYVDSCFEVTSQSGDSEAGEDDHLDSTDSSEGLDNRDKSCVSPSVVYFINSNVTVVDQSSPATEREASCPAATLPTSELRSRRSKHTDSEEELKNEVRYLKQRLVDLTVQKWQDSVKIILLKKKNGQLELALSAERLHKQVYENTLQPPRWFAGQRFHFIEGRNVMRKRKPPRSSTHAHGDADG